MRNNVFQFGLAVLATFALGAQDQNVPPKATLKLASSTALPGSQLKSTLTLTFSPGLHGYQNPPTKDYMIPVSVESATPGVKLTVKYPEGVVKEIAGESAAVYDGTTTIPLVFTLPKKTGPIELKVKVNYQQCTDTACFPPGSVLAAAKVTVKPKNKGFK